MYVYLRAKPLQRNLANLFAVEATQVKNKRIISSKAIL